MFNINLRSRSAEFIYTPLLTLSIFILSLRLGSDVLKYLHGCSQYVQYQPTFKICGIYLYTSAYPQYIQYQPTFNIWWTKLFTRLALYIQYQPTFKIWVTKLYTSAYHQSIQYQPTFKIWRTKLFTRLPLVYSISTYVQDLRN